MKRNLFYKSRTICGVLSILIGILWSPGATNAQPPAVKNVVIVHGAFADASGWQGVYAELTKHGFVVTLVQNPCTSLKEDVDVTNVALDKMDGPVILVGHSWGGTVITQAGVHTKVSALVYVNGFQPEVGENTVFSWVEWPSKDARVEGWKKIMEDDRMKPDGGTMPFDGKRMIYGGFAPLLDA